MLKKLIVAAGIILAASGGAMAQSGQLARGEVWGNFGASAGPGKPTSLMTFPVVSGNLACFNGSTGKLQDCAFSPASIPSVTIERHGGGCSDVAPFISDNTAALLAAVSSVPGSVRVLFPNNCTYAFTQANAINFSKGGVFLEGVGRFGTVLQYTPAADGTFLKWSNGINEMFWGGISKLALISADTTHSKVMVEWYDVSSFDVDHIYCIGGSSTKLRGGANKSACLYSHGRDDAHISKFQANAEIPIRIGMNPHHYLSADHYHFSDIYTIGDIGSGSNPLILVDPGVVFTNTTFDGEQAWVGGAHGFDWTDTAAAHYVSAVTAGGSGYTVGTPITLGGGTCSTAITVIPLRVNGSGAIIPLFDGSPGASIANPGVCTVTPSNPVSATSGGAAFNLTLVASYRLAFSNVRTEQGVSTSAFTFNIRPAGAIQGLTINNSVMEPGRCGAYLKNAVLPTIRDSTKYPGGCNEAVNATSANGNDGLRYVNNFWIPGVTQNVTGMTAVESSEGPAPTSSTVPPSAYYSASIANTNFNNVTVANNVAANKGAFGANITPDAALTVNNNTGAAGAPAFQIETHLIGTDGGSGGVLSDVFSGEAFFAGRAAGGTRASKSGVVAGSAYLALLGQTYDGSAYASNSVLEFLTINAQSGADHSSRARLRLVPAGSTSIADVMLWGPGVAIGSGAADPGAGNLNLGGGKLQNNGTDPTGTGAYVRATSPTIATPTVSSPTFTGTVAGAGTIPNSVLVNSFTTINGTAIALGGSATVTAAASSMAVGTTTVTGGTNARVLYDNAGLLGEYTATQLTAQINAATATLSGALPAWPNNTTSFFRGDGTYASPATLTFGTHLASGGVSYNGSTGVTITSDATAANTASTIMARDGSGQVAATTFTGALAGNATTATSAPASGLTGATLASNVLASSLTSVGTLTGGATGAGFTVALGTSTITGQLPLANGGTAASLTASNGGIFYSTASAGAILAGTATARQMLQSGASGAPAWSTTTWPATTTINRLLYSSAANVISDLATANSAVLVTDSGGIPLLSTTLPALTLGGTISGGGNNVNNVIIGASNPLAITGTTITGNTSVSSPIHTASGALTFQSNGSTFAGSVSTGQLWYLGATSLTPATGTTLTVSQNTGGSPTVSALANMIGQFIAADSVIGLVALDTFGNQGFLASRYAGGTQASKTAAAGTIATFSFGAQAWDGSAWGTGAAMDFQTTASTWSGSNHGMTVRFRTVADGSTSLTEAMRINSGLAVGTSSDPGAGMIYTNAATFMIRTKTSYTNGAAAAAGTLANAPVAGNPTKWIPVDDNGTTRYIPAW
jgi:hypothetical protein